MEFHFLHLFSLLFLMSLGCEAALPPEVYWHSKLPNTPIPNHLLSLLQPDVRDKPAYWDIGVDGDNHDQPLDYQPLYWKKPYIADNQHFIWKKPYIEKGKHDGKFQTNNEGKFITDKLPTTPKFLLHNDFQVGKKIRLQFITSTNKARILSRRVTDSIPFSIDKLPEIYERFSIKTESIQGELVKKTVTKCESPGLETEDKFCAKSLESMVDKSVKRVGNEVQVYYNKIEKWRSSETEQDYSIENVKLIGEKQVSCHKMKYPYAVYYCHELKGTKVYEVGLISSEGKQGSIVVVCHSDTSGWHPKHLAFLVLKMKPGEGTICHTMTSDTIVWVPST